MKNEWGTVVVNEQVFTVSRIFTRGHRLYVEARRYGDTHVEPDDLCVWLSSTGQPVLTQHISLPEGPATAKSANMIIELPFEFDRETDHWILSHGGRDE